MPSPSPIEHIFELWENNPNRVVLIVDEIRQKINDQDVTTFCCVKLSARNALDAINFARDARVACGGQAANSDFKGKKLFGSRSRPSHNPMRHYVFDSISKMDALGIMVTNEDRISEHDAHSRGGITLRNDNGTSRVEGRELNFLNGFLKKISNEWGIGQQEIDVVVDRSHQLGSSPSVRGIEATQFEVWGPSTLNVLVGGRPSEAICETSFRFIQVSDSTPVFRDLLLLPDAIGYLGSMGGAFNAAADFLNTQTSGWVYHANLDAIKQAAVELLNESFRRST